jgi:hypothetical protein
LVRLLLQPIYIMKPIYLLLSIVLSSAAFAQNNFTINGTVKDALTGETIIGASVFIENQKGLGAITNAYGYFAVSATKGTYKIITNSNGYKTDTLVITLIQNETVNIVLQRFSKQLDEVIVNSKKKNENISKPIMGVQKLTVKEIQNIPVLFGEKDILKTIQLLPGIKTAGEGNSGFFVRGGGADQNLILLDEAPVYNASHLLGFFSTFNSDAIKDVTVFKGGMPAEYGGRLSSVVDIKMNDGNNKKTSVSGGIGLIASRINIEGPIVKEKASYTVSARRTYADAFLAFVKDSSIRNNTLYFYDINAKANYKINNKNRLFLSFYTGRDNFGFGSTFGIDYGNATGTLRWNHVFNSRLFSNTSLIYSNYSYQIKISSGNNDIRITSRIRDWNLKQDFQYFINANNKLSFGANIIHHNIVPGVVTASANSSFNNLQLQEKYSLESAAYISHEYSINPKINITYGLRFSMFNVLGPGAFYNYNANGTIKDSSVYGKGDIVKTYFNPEPRFAISYQLKENTSIKFSYTKNVQNLHLLNNSTAANPTDLWLGSSNNVRPQIADQIALGFYKNFADGKYEFSVETYYKDLQNQIDYKNGAELRANENVESQLLYGIGRAYGIELFVKKKYGKLNGWIGYTLSRTERKIEGINSGNWFKAIQDRPHELSIVGIYEASKKWTFSSSFIYYTGSAVTYPSGKYEINGQVYFTYADRNTNRLPNYHRLDISATLNVKKRKNYESNWSFSIYNLYSRENAFAINFREDQEDPTKTQAVQTTLFRIVPSVTYNFKF